jgi:hypothetical protein
MIRLRILIVGAFLAACFSSSAQVQILPSDRAPIDQTLPWNFVGVPGGISNYTQFASVMDAPYSAFGDGAHDDWPSFTNAIAHCPAGQYVLVPKGHRFLLGTNLSITKSGVALRGEDPFSSMLVFTSVVGQAAIDITPGSLGASSTAINSGATRGSTSVVVASAAGFSVGKIAHLKQSFSATIAPGPVPGSGVDAIINQEVMVTNISSTTIQFTPPLMDTYDVSLSPVLESYSGTVYGIGLQDLGIDIEGTLATGGSQNGVRLFNTYGCWVVNCMVTNAPHESISAIYSAQGSILDSVPTHHQTYTATERYQIQISTRCFGMLVQNNVGQAGNVVFICQDGSGGSVFGYNFSDMAFFTASDTDPTDSADGMCLHGGAPNKILSEGNVVQELRIDNTWGANLTNAFLRNWATAKNYINDSGLISTHENAVWFDSSYNLGASLIGNVATLYTSTFGSTYTVSASAYLFMHGNVDVPAATTQWSNSISHTIPSSYYLASKPAWFGSMAWPPVGPDVTTPLSPSVVIPAQYRYSIGVFIYSNPLSQTVTAPATATFTANGWGMSGLSYQWKKNGSNIGGATASSYTTPATTSGNNGDLYTCAISDYRGATLSAAATLSVNGSGVIGGGTYTKTYGRGTHGNGTR